LCSPTLTPHLTWTVEQYLHGSDHFPIKITLEGSTLKNCYTSSRCKIANADWSNYARAIADTLQNPQEITDVNAALEELNTIVLGAAHQHIGKSMSRLKSSYKPVPWWNLACGEAVKTSNKNFNMMKRNPTVENIISFKKAGAHKRFTLRKSKKTVGITTSPT
jgi:hypothetical protein